MPKSLLKALRDATGMTQAELAARAGVSRQLVGAVEAGRHLPRVDAALALAAALGVEVESLFGSDQAPVDIVSGSAPVDGSLVRAGRVGDRPVTAPARLGPDGWDVADAIMKDGTLNSFRNRAPGLVVAGCEPGLDVWERLLREAGMGAVAAICSSRAALDALVVGRVHAAVVHGPENQVMRGPEDLELDRFRLARWRVGIAAPSDVKSGWCEDVLSGRVPVVQREEGAGVQRAFENAVSSGTRSVPGPRVASHVEAARRAVLTGMPAVTIEPAALAVGAVFHPLEVHAAELWVSREWQGHSAVNEALHVLSSRRFMCRLDAIGGYDLAGCGTRLP